LLILLLLLLLLLLPALFQSYNDRFDAAFSDGY
jgi:hypothetical protein